MPTRNRKSKGAMRMDPNLFILENVAVTDQDLVVNTTIFTNSEKQRYLFALRSANVSMPACATGANITYFVLRRVPSGYSAPAATVATGLTVWADQPDVLAYAYYISQGASTTPVNVEFTKLKRNVVLYEGDLVVLQAVPSTGVDSSFYGQIEFGTRGL